MDAHLLPKEVMPPKSNPYASYKTHILHWILVKVIKRLFIIFIMEDFPRYSYWGKWIVGF